MRGAATRVLTLAGIMAPVVYVGAVIYCGAMRPGYDHVTQFMSELAERGSPTEMTMRVAGFWVPGLLILAFGTSLLTRPVAWPVALLLVVHGIGRVTSGIFPCDPGCRATGASFSQMMHNGAAVVNALTVLAAATIWSFSARTAGRRRFALYSLVSAIVGLVFFVLMILDAVTRVHVGLYQRLSFGILTLWIGALAVSLWPTGSAVADRQMGR